MDDIPLDEKNIAYKTADAFFQSTKKKNKGIHIDIVKRIPHAAGMAGGSADGAKNATLNELTAHYTGKQVVALPIEATAIGNLKIQMQI